MTALTAMIVDDSRVARMTLSKLLKSRQLEVVEYADAEQALAALQTDAAPDLIFMDMMMEGMDGLTATARIKSDPRFADLPVIICTGNDGEVEQHRADIAGAHSILSKPPQIEVLDAIIAELQTTEPALMMVEPAESRLTVDELSLDDDSLSFDLSEPVSSGPVPDLTPVPLSASRDADASMPTLEQMQTALNNAFVPQLQRSLEQQTRQLTEQLFEQLAQQLQQKLSAKPAAEMSLMLQEPNADPDLDQRIAVAVKQALLEENLAEKIQRGISEQMTPWLNKQQAETQSQLPSDVMQSVQAEIQRELQKLAGKQLEAMLASKLSTQQSKIQNHLAAMEQDWQMRLAGLKRLAIGSALAAIVAILVAVLV